MNDLNGLHERMGIRKGIYVLESRHNVINLHKKKKDSIQFIIEKYSKYPSLCITVKVDISLVRYNTKKHEHH